MSLRMSNSVRGLDFALNADESQPPEYSLAFDLIWSSSDSTGCSTYLREESKRVFWSENPCGEKFLCFLITHADSGGALYSLPYTLKVSLF